MMSSSRDSPKTRKTSKEAKTETEAMPDATFNDIPKDVMLDMLVAMDVQSMMHLINTDRQMIEFFKKHEEVIYRERLFHDFGISSYEKMYKKLYFIQQKDAKNEFGLKPVEPLSKNRCTASKVNKAIKKTINHIYRMDSGDRKVLYMRLLFETVINCVDVLQNQNLKKVIFTKWNDLQKQIMDSSQISARVKKEWNQFYEKNHTFMTQNYSDNGH